LASLLPTQLYAKQRAFLTHFIDTMAQLMKSGFINALCINQC